MTIPTIAQVRLADQQRQARILAHNKRLGRQAEVQERDEQVPEQVQEEWRLHNER